jgi:acyl-CoA thioester hydrolase
MVHSHSDFFGSIAFPAVAELCLRVNKLGKSSVTYEVGFFEKGAEEVKAVGELIHVFVDRDSGRPTTKGMNEDFRKGLERLLVREREKL